ncbi:hypothetical protein TUM20249_61220 [Pseudomonas tohonis]|nr:hypothetical protein TUM20249_61220 [Pseudomonas tohonis]
MKERARERLAEIPARAAPGAFAYVPGHGAAFFAARELSEAILALSPWHVLCVVLYSVKIGGASRATA